MTMYQLDFFKSSQLQQSKHSLCTFVTVDKYSKEQCGPTGVSSQVQFCS